MSKLHCIHRHSLSLSLSHLPCNKRPLSTSLSDLCQFYTGPTTRGVCLSTCLHSFPFPCTGLEINFIEIFFSLFIFYSRLKITRCEQTCYLLETNILRATALFFYLIIKISLNQFTCPQKIFFFNVSYNFTFLLEAS